MILTPISRSDHGDRQPYTRGWSPYLDELPQPVQDSFEDLAVVRVGTANAGVNMGEVAFGKIAEQDLDNTQRELQLVCEFGDRPRLPAQQVDLLGLGEQVPGWIVAGIHRRDHRVNHEGLA